MKKEAFIIEQTYSAPVTSVWNALTDKNEMKLWYFDLPDFRPETCCEFHFWGGPTEDRQYKHLCRVEEVILNKKIAYSWRYEGYSGNTLVSFELSGTDPGTRLKLTHEGLESLPSDSPDLARENFVQGWTWIIGTSLKNYFENKA